MQIPRLKQIRLASMVIFAALLGVAIRSFVAAPLAAAPGEGRNGSSETANEGSRITHLAIAGSQPAGTFAGVAYRRVWGTVFGIVAPRDAVRGFDQLKGDDGNYVYESEFEIIEPEKLGTNSVIVVEAENRGTPVFLNALHEIAVTGPPSATTNGGDAGNGFLFAHGTSYARVQWQAGIAASVPMQAEGVGEVIMRDFGRLLAGRTQLDTKPLVEIGTYHTLILGGVSLSGFFIDTFLQEGFNADPGDGSAVYQGAIAVDGTGNWLALNELAAAADSKQFPYLVPDGKPLSSWQILGGHASDPFYIDIANYTDFYRLRASLTDVDSKNKRIRRYDWPSAHAPAPIDQSGMSARVSRCNGGVVLDLNPISHSAYLRAVTLELEHELGVPSAKQAPPLPPTTLFTLDPDPAPSKLPNFNPLPGVRLFVPLVDEDAQPMGGVRFPDVEHPVGKPVPASLPPVTTTSIDATCGNLGGWQQFSPEELTKRYGSEANYLKLYGASLDRLIARGYLLASDREEMLKTASALYERHPTH
jgi:hypothetical protein